MQTALNRLIEYVHTCEQIPVRHLFTGENRPCPDKQLFIHPIPRIIQPLSGKKHIRFAAGGKIQDLIFLPGDVLFTRQYGWTEELWDSPHEMISVVFYPDYLRVLYIANDGTHVQNGPDLFHHCRPGLDENGNCLIRYLDGTPPQKNSAACCLHALLAKVRETLEAELSEKQTPQQIQMARIEELIQTKFCGSVSRDDIAEQSGIHAAQISRLVRQFHNMSFPAYIAKLRLEYAVKLLGIPDLPVADIAQRAGFSYANYFIRLFHKQFGLTPEQFRENSRKNCV